MGVTTKKKIIPIIIGETIFDNKIPNLNHNLLSWFNNFEFNNQRIKKINAIKIAQYLISP